MRDWPALQSTASPDLAPTSARVELALVGELPRSARPWSRISPTDHPPHPQRRGPRHRGSRRRRRQQPSQSVLRLEARREGDHIVITVADDGRGMDREAAREALAQGVITAEEASTLDERQSWRPHLPARVLHRREGFRRIRSRRRHGRVRTNIQKPNGSIEIQSQLGKGTTLLIHLPLTLAILPVLLVRLGVSPSRCHCRWSARSCRIEPGGIQDVGGKATMVVRGEVLPIVPLSALLGWPREAVPQYGVVMQSVAPRCSFSRSTAAGREGRGDQVARGLFSARRAWPGVTTLANGQIVLILDMKGAARIGWRTAQRVALDAVRGGVASDRPGGAQAVSSSSPEKACSNCARFLLQALAHSHEVDAGGRQRGEVGGGLLDVLFQRRGHAAVVAQGVQGGVGRG